MGLRLVFCLNYVVFLASCGDNREIKGKIQPAFIGAKTIWTFWDRGREHLPAFNKANLKVWQGQVAEGWEIRVLSEVPEDPDFLFSWIRSSDLPKLYWQLTAQARSDAVRLALIHIYGGIWMDSSVIPLRSLDFICWDDLKSGKVEFCGYNMKQEALVGEYEHDFFESWFIASEPNKYVTSHWYGRFKEYHNIYENGSGLKEFWNTKDVEHSVLYGGYLTIHAALMGLLRSDTTAREIYTNRTKLHDGGASFLPVGLKENEGISDPDWIKARFLKDKDEEELQRLLTESNLLKFNGNMAKAFEHLDDDGMMDTRHQMGRLYELLLENPLRK